MFIVNFPVFLNVFMIFRLAKMLCIFIRLRSKHISFSSPALIVMSDSLLCYWNPLFVYVEQYNVS